MGLFLLTHSNPLVMWVVWTGKLYELLCARLWIVTAIQNSDFILYSIQWLLPPLNFQLTSCINSESDRAKLFCWVKFILEHVTTNIWIFEYLTCDSFNTCWGQSVISVVKFKLTRRWENTINLICLAIQSSSFFIKRTIITIFTAKSSS